MKRFTLAMAAASIILLTGCNPSLWAARFLSNQVHARSESCIDCAHVPVYIRAVGNNHVQNWRDKCNVNWYDLFEVTVPEFLYAPFHALLIVILFCFWICSTRLYREIAGLLMAGGVAGLLFFIGANVLFEGDIANSFLIDYLACSCAALFLYGVGAVLVAMILERIGLIEETGLAGIGTPL